MMFSSKSEKRVGVKGRVLYIGTSYYNNWYLSRELRKLGWRADLLVCSPEGAEPFLHGCDFYLREYLQWDGGYDKRVYDFLKPLLKRCAESIPMGRGKLSPKGRVEKISWPAFSLIPKRIMGLGLVTKLAEKLVELQLQRKGSLETIEYLLEFFLRKESLEMMGYLLELFLKSTRQKSLQELLPLEAVWRQYDIIHFTGVNSLRYFYFFNPHLFGSMPIGWDIKLLKRLGNKIVFTNTGCMDGVSPSSFRMWRPQPVCDICRWHYEPEVCSDQGNLAWGRLRNELADYQCTLGGNRADYNDDPRVHEVPEFYCLDPIFWHPDIEIPKEHRIHFSADSLKIYHGVGNYDLRTDGTGENIKCTHIYVPLIERLKREGYKVEIVFAKDIPGKDVRFYQAQSDIVVDMLTFGFFGANVREGMMLGKPCVCFLRPEWLESMRREIPEYVDQLPVISATPDTVYQVLKDLLDHPEKRRAIGKESREFAIKWHSSESGARRLDKIYSDLMSTS